MVLIDCFQWDVLMVNDLLADLSRMALNTAVLISPKKLFVAGQRGHMMHSRFLNNTWIQQLCLFDYLDTMAVMINLMMWQLRILDKTSVIITVAVLVRCLI